MAEPAPSPAVFTDGPKEAPNPDGVIPISGKVLLARHAGGDPHAFARLMKLYSSRIYGYLTRCRVAQAERDDLFQEIFCKVHRAASNQPPAGELTPWIFAVAVNTVRSHYRAAKVRSVVELREDPCQGQAIQQDAADDVVEAGQTAQWLEVQLGELPLEQREVLLLCCVEGLEQKDAALALDVPINTVKTRLRRARLALAEARSRRRLQLAREASR